MIDLGRYSKVYRRIWRDEKFRGLSDAGKLLFLRLMTGPELGAIPGVLACTDAGLAASMGWTVEAFREAFREAYAKGMVRADWKAGLVWLPKATRYARPESPNVIRGPWRRQWGEVPECALKQEIAGHLEAFAEGLGRAFREAYGKAFEEGAGNPCPIQEQEQEQDHPLPPQGDSAAPAGAGPAAGPLPPPRDPAGPAAAEPPPSGPLTDRRRPNSRARAHHVDPDAPRDDLSEPERVRRGYYRAWQERYGTPYPQEPGRDHAVACWLLQEHRRRGPAEPWAEWVPRVIAVYLDLDGPFYAGHALTKLRTAAPQILAALASDAQPTANDEETDPYG